MGYMDPIQPGEHISAGDKPGWYYGPVHPSAKIGEGTTVDSSAWVGPGVVIGQDCAVGPGVVIGSRGFGYEHSDNHWIYREHPFGVTIGDDVTIGANTVIDRGRWRNTQIGDGAKIDAHCFIAHNVHIGRDCLVIANTMIAGSCEIGDDCWIGPSAQLTDHVTVGDNARVGIGAVVIRDVPAGFTVVGNPARPLKPSQKATGAVLTASEEEGWENLATTLVSSPYGHDSAE